MNLPIRVEFKTSQDSVSLGLATQVSTAVRDQLTQKLGTIRTENDEITESIHVRGDGFNVTVYTRYSGRAEFQFSEPSDHCVEAIVNAVNHLAENLKTREEWQAIVTGNCEAFVSKILQLVSYNKDSIVEKMSLDDPFELEKGVGGTVRCGDTDVEYALKQRREAVRFELRLGNEKIVVSYKRHFWFFLIPESLKYTGNDVSDIELLSPNLSSFKLRIGRCLNEIEDIKATLKTIKAFQRA